MTKQIIIIAIIILKTIGVSAQILNLDSVSYPFYQENRSIALQSYVTCINDSTYKIHYKSFFNCTSETGITTLLYDLNVSRLMFCGIKLYNTCNYPATLPTTTISLCDNSYGDTLLVNSIKRTLPKYLENGDPNGSIIKDYLCPNYLTTCDSPFNQANVLKSVREVDYDITVVLPEKCNEWSCIFNRNNYRDSIITNVQKYNFGFILTKFNNTSPNNIPIKNNSAKASFNPNVYAGVNQAYSFNPGFIDPDGDSLVFTSITPLTNDTGKFLFDGCDYTAPWHAIHDIAYIAPFTVNNPFACNNTFAINANNGTISFTASAPAIPTIAMRIDEYRHGLWVGSIMQEYTFFIDNYPSILPFTDSVLASNGLSQLGNRNYAACANHALNMCIWFSNSDSLTQTKLITNIATSMPTATITKTHKSKDSVLLCINWLPTNADTGTHSITVTCIDTSCRAPGIIIPKSFTYDITINPAPVIFGSNSICSGASTVLQASYAFGTCNWYSSTGQTVPVVCNNANCSSITVSPTTTQDYIVFCNNSNGVCNTSDTFTLRVVQDFTVQSSDVLLCKSVPNVLLTTTVFGNNIPVTYKWLPNIGIIGSNNKDSVTINPSNSTYYVIVKDTSNCFTHVDTAKIIYDPTFAVNATANKTGVCLGDTIILTATGGNTIWLPNYNIANNKASVTSIWPDSSVTYIAKVTSPISGCTGSAAIAVDIVALRAQLINDTTITDGDVINIGTPYTICDNDCNYFWYDSRNLDLSNAIHGSSLNPLVRPPGDTWFRLTVNSKNGECRDVDSVLVIVKCKDLWMPNAFNPASAIESNRKFGVRNVGVALDYFRIINRYGETVFTTLDPLIKWDGTYKGKPCAMDTYFWMAKGVCDNGNDFIDKGEVILIR